MVCTVVVDFMLKLVLLRTEVSSCGIDLGNARFNVRFGGCGSYSSKCYACQHRISVELCVAENAVYRGSELGQLKINVFLVFRSIGRVIL